MRYSNIYKVRKYYRDESLRDYTVIYDIDKKLKSLASYIAKIIGFTCTRILRIYNAKVIKDKELKVWA